MRQRPLPNRHAHDLSLFAESMQARLNRNRHKLDLHEMTLIALLWKLLEETLELVCEIIYQGVRRLLGASPEYRKMESEALDVGVVVLALWMWTRESSRCVEKEGSGG